MKKYWVILFFPIFLFSILNGQNYNHLKESLDLYNKNIGEIVQDFNSILIEKIIQNWNETDWINFTKTEIKYNLSELKEEEKEFGWDNSEWNEYKRTSYIYNIKNLLIEMFVEESFLNWIKNLVVTYVYDEQDRVSETIVKNWNQDQNTYIIWKTLFQYHSENNVSEEILQRYENEIWINDQRTIYNYDINKNIIENLLQYWENNNWQNYTRYNYIFDEDLNLIQSFQLEWINSDWDTLNTHSFLYNSNKQIIEENRQVKQNGIWIKASKKSFDYDEKGNLIIQMFQYWLDSLLVNGNINYYEFNTDGRITQEIEKVWRNDGWENDSKVNYEYDLNGILIQKIHQNWIEDVWENTIKYIYIYENVTGIKGNNISINNFILSYNYPNPFNPMTVIRFCLPEANKVTLVVYDMLGREVVRLVDCFCDPGWHELSWDGQDSKGIEVPTGLYITKLSTPLETKVIRMLMIK